MAYLLRFGIPTLDELIGHGANLLGFRLPEQSGAQAASMCLLGPDGTGKSVLGLHLASRYAADHADTNARVLYVSIRQAEDRTLGSRRFVCLSARPALTVLSLPRLSDPAVEGTGTGGVPFSPGFGLAAKRILK